MVSWNPWHGCKKYSEGCKNCYVFRDDENYGRDPSKITVTKSFDLPIKRNRQKEYKYPAGTKFFTCYTTDFFLPEMREERLKALDIIKERSDCSFFIITKRIDLVDIDIPDNVEICCTIENQKQFDYRWPIFNKLKAKHKSICIEPLLEPINLGNISVERIFCGGESGYGDSIRPCDEYWVRDLYIQAKKLNIPFCFKQTGTYFKRLNGEQITILRRDQLTEADKLRYQDFKINEE